MNITYNPCPQTCFNRQSPTFKALKEPRNYWVIKEGVLAKGRWLDREENFDFIIKKGYKSILSLLGRSSVRDSAEKNSIDDLVYIEKELDFIYKYNKRNQQNKITFESVPLWGYCPDRAKEFELAKIRFIGLINRLPKPIYMHCLTGNDTSHYVTEFFKEALKSGKIKLD